MEIRELYHMMQTKIEEEAPLSIDPTLLLAVRKTKRGLETAGVLDFRYDPEISAWLIEINTWESAGIKCQHKWTEIEGYTDLEECKICGSIRTNRKK